MSEVQALLDAWVRGGATSQDCPPAEALWDGARGELSPEAVGVLVDHLSGCAGCAADWATAIDVQRALPAELSDDVDAASPVEAVDAASPMLAVDASSPVEASAEVVSLADRRARARRWGAVGGIALAAAAVFAMISVPPEDPQTPTYRSGQDIIELRTVPDAVLSSDAMRLEWASKPDWTYDVFVSDETLNPIHTAYGLGTDHIVLPDEVTADLSSGQMLLWRVEGLGPDGTRRSSRTSTLRVK